MCLPNLLFSSIKENNEEWGKRESDPYLNWKSQEYTVTIGFFWFHQLVSSKLVESRQISWLRKIMTFHNKHALVDNFIKQQFS